MNKTLKLSLGDVVQNVSTGIQYPIKWVGEYCGLQVASINAWNCFHVEPNYDGYYYEVDDTLSTNKFVLLPRNTRYCHLHTQPELQCTEQCNHCTNFDKSIK
ncbi:MAG: hypothetical protein ABL940_08240 [Bacteroidia bacterium]